MIITTTSTLQNKNITKYLGIVSGEVIIGANFIKDIKASIRDFVGGRSGTYERVIVEAKEQALSEMTQRAISIGANAIIGVDFDFETIGANGSMIMVAATGTAIVTE